MGCAQSKIENEESVARCKDRKNFMKEAVSARNAFSAAHSGYTVALKDTGAALSDYAQGEAETDPDQNHHMGRADDPAPEPPPPPPPMMEPPPPPLPNFSPVTPLQRAVTMPEFPVSTSGRKFKNLAVVEADGEEVEEEEVRDVDLERRKGGKKGQSGGADEVGPETPVTPPPPSAAKGMAWDYFFMVDDHIPAQGLNEADNELSEQHDENEVGGEGFGSGAGGGVANMVVGGNGGGDDEPKTPENAIIRKLQTEEEETPAAVTKEKQFIHSNAAPPGIGGVSNVMKGRPSVDLLKVLTELDDEFLEASKSAQEVSKMLEATRLHYHSNFADNRGHIDHAERVMRVITWNKSYRGVSNGEGGNDDFDSGEYETHATVLDKLLAWEKKLYEEVKAGELIKLEYQRKVTLLNKQRKRSASSESLEKTKATVSHLHTRYIVDMQSLDSTVSEINHIRDNELYPKLVDLVKEMAKMWESMCIHHDNQLKIVSDLRSLEVWGTPRETSKRHYEQTIQLSKVVHDWQSQFEKLVSNQKRYIQALNNWLKLNLISIESSLKEKISSPPRIQNPPIQPLLHSWHDHLVKLPDELAKSAIDSFAAVIKTIIVLQEEEMSLKEKCEETRKEFLRKKQAFEEWYQKYMQRRTPPEEMDPERGATVNPKDPVLDRRFVVESLEKKLEEEVEAYQKHCLQVREKSLGSLKLRLPELFRAMSDYSHACFDAYESLRSLTQGQNVGSL